MFHFRFLCWVFLVFWTLLPVSALQFPSSHHPWTHTCGSAVRPSASAHHWPYGQDDSVPLHPGSVLGLGSGASSPHHVGFHRWGEALNPGPPCDLAGIVPFCFANPSGLRNKEEVIISMGPGVHSFSETQLSKQTQRSSAKALRYHASLAHRDIRVHYGAPVAPRSNSSWAGGWSGVATISDYPSREVCLPYGDERDCGRLLVTEHYFAEVSVQRAVVYGFPAGPTWPRAKELTSSLLQILSTEVVLGSSGPRIIGGDFNAEQTSLETFDYWTRLGWQHAQSYALRAWNQEPCLTCKNATTPDHVWLSPEAVALCRYVEVTDTFSEHATVTVGLDVAGPSLSVLEWPLPSPIPWDQVDPAWLATVQPPVWDVGGSCDAQWSQLGSSVELSLDGFVGSQPKRSLQSNQKGRLQRTQPQLRPPQPRLVRASRPSEVLLRNDLIGSATKSWFRQLRRLQSFSHAATAGKATVNAVVYRLELWTSIIRAPGFQDGFCTWWRYHRSCVFPDAPQCLPTGPPDATVARAIFLNFKACFERFESWHVRQRAHLLRSKYDQGVRALYQDLSKGRKGHLDCLTTCHEYGVLAVEEHTGQVHLDRDVVLLGHSIWLLDDQRVEVEYINDVVLQLRGVVCEVGQVLVQKHTLTQTSDLHQALLDYWTPTWTAWHTVDDATWHRVVNFMQAYVPRLDFALPPISLTQWKRALKRYKPSAARGVDGVSHLDLLHWPDAWSLRVLDLLHQIEVGADSWPLALLFGVVNVLAKDDHAQSVDRFRPAVVFSILYRTWSSIRASQLLRRVTPFIDAEAFGFLPGHEPSQLWLMLQSQVELALQVDSDLCGLSTDLVRAFNHIPRQHSFKLASHLGAPPCITLPWRSFLDSCSRSFKIRGALSDTTHSSCGMPEGDALSVYAMVQLGWMWHIYMQKFCPRVRSLSFVDNLTLVGTRPFDLAWGWSCLTTFFHLWNLRVDLGKSYCWGLTKSLRDQLACLPMELVPHARELGGALSFTKRQHTGLQLQRSSTLLPRWDLLRGSRAPLCQKFLALATVFWASALHGAHGSGVGSGHISRLRSTALKSLGLNKAGVNGLLRLSLSVTPKADPGFWLLSNTFHSFRRLAYKEPRLLAGLTKFLLHFDGKLLSGPYSHLVESCSLLGWSLRPPYFLDHDGCQHHLLALDESSLDSLLWDGWLQLVARSVSHRNTMQDLDGLDMCLVRADHAQLDALDSSLLGSLQAGAFVSTSSHSKFDATKMPYCQICGVADTQSHMLDCPRFASIRAGIPGWERHSELDTLALSVHLLPSRPAQLGDWKTALLELPDHSSTFWSGPLGTGTQHLFTDGSATTGHYSYAAWGCLNATSGQVVSCGHVPGLGQSSDRAELWAAISALRWFLRHKVSGHLWLDAKFVADGLSFIQEFGQVGPWKNHDLWDVLVDLLAQLSEQVLVLHWIPSHLDASQLEDAFEDWVRLWNSRVDSMVGRFNHDRPPAFRDLHKTLTERSDKLRRRIHMFRQFWFGVAKVKHPTSTVPTVTLVDDDGDIGDHFTISDLLVGDVSVVCEPLCLRQPIRFAVSIFDWILRHERCGTSLYPLSFVELALALASDPTFCFPFENAKSGHTELLPLCARFTKPTLAYILKHVRDAVLSSCRQLGFSSVLFQGQTKVSVGIHRFVDGFYIHLAGEHLFSIQQRALAFFEHRPYRRSCDLARPL